MTVPNVIENQVIQPEWGNIVADDVNSHELRLDVDESNIAAITPSLVLLGAAFSDKLAIATGFTTTITEDAFAPFPQGTSLPIAYGFTFAAAPVVVATGNYVGVPPLHEEVYSRSTTEFRMRVWDLNGAPIGFSGGFSVSWIAIGRRP